MSLKVVVSTSTNPYINVAVENYLVDCERNEDVYMYLWKNKRTVVIGQNQNPYSECNVERLISDGGFLMRRTTGGGAVYHDDGNLNFSFIASRSQYDTAKQFDVIVGALAQRGLKTKLSGRNDMLVCDGAGEWRKFSGNAFSKGRNKWLHHGTLLIKSNMDDLSLYLKVNPSKLHKHGVASVGSRVVNLSEISDIDSDSIVANLVKSFESVYGGEAVALEFGSLSSLDEVVRMENKFSSEQWLYGKWSQFSATHEAQFDWGRVEVSVDVDEQKGIVTDICVASDALDVMLPTALHDLLVGASLTEPPAIDPSHPLRGQLKDVIDLLYLTD